MVMPNSIFHYVAYQVIEHYLQQPGMPVLVADCKPATVDTVEDNRTDFTLKVVHHEHGLLCYIVFRMSSFASINSFDVLSNIKVYDRHYVSVVNELRLTNFRDGVGISDAIIRFIDSLLP